jgi:hypothetical protein
MKSMLPKRTFVIVGISFLVFGIIFLLTGAESITGNIVMENVDKGFGSMTSLTGYWLVAAGVVMLWVGKVVR